MLRALRSLPSVPPSQPACALLHRRNPDVTDDATVLLRHVGTRVTYQSSVVYRFVMRSLAVTARTSSGAVLGLNPSWIAERRRPAECATSSSSSGIPPYARSAGPVSNCGTDLRDTRSRFAVEALNRPANEGLWDGCAWHARPSLRSARSLGRVLGRFRLRPSRARALGRGSLFFVDVTPPTNAVIATRAIVIRD
jgi:hypothetical protein